MAKSKEFIESLEDKAWKYIEECIGNEIETVSGGRKIVLVNRHIPTIGYFLRIWIPMNHGETITRKTWYTWLHEKDEATGEPNEKCNTIKRIDSLFRDLARDIVANEGKGIFYAKNFLNMTDKMEHANNKEQPLFGKDVNG